jgi:hypothetical protein
MISDYRLFLFLLTGMLLCYQFHSPGYLACYIIFSICKELLLLILFIPILLKRGCKDKTFYFLQNFFRKLFFLPPQGTLCLTLILPYRAKTGAKVIDFSI